MLFAYSARKQSFALIAVRDIIALEKLNDK